jgi:hypothetical protein
MKIDRYGLGFTSIFILLLGGLIVTSGTTCSLRIGLVQDIASRPNIDFPAGVHSYVGQIIIKGVGWSGLILAALSQI